MDSAPLTPPDLSDLVARRTRRGPGGRRERPFRFLLDSRLFRLLCDPGQPATLYSFRASLVHLGLAPEGGLPDLQMTPLAIIDVIGVEPPQFPALPHLPKSMATLEDVEVGILFKEQIQKNFRKAPDLEPSSLKRPWRSSGRRRTRRLTSCSTCV